MESRENNRLARVLAVVLVFGVIITYAPALKFGFVDYDDDVYVTANAHVQRGLTWDGVAWTFYSTEGGNYWHPLTWLSHMLDCQLFGLNPWGHHLTSILLHAANTLLVFLALRRLTGATWRSLFVAAVFGLHPLRVESVAWVAERKDVLSTFFWMLSLWTYAGYVEESRRAQPPSRKSRWLYSLTLLWFALGLMSKPMVVTLPFVLLLLDYWPLRRISDFGFQISDLKRENGEKFENLRRLLLEKVPFFLLAMAVSAAAYLVQKHGGIMNAMSGLSLGARVENALVSYCRYLGKLFCPVDLAVFYPHPDHWPASAVGAAALLLLGLTVLALMTWRTHPYLLVGWFWFVGTLVPAIGLVQVGAQAMADRYSYVPTIGVLLILAWGAHDLTNRWRLRTGPLSVVAVATLLFCVVLTRQQIGYWRDSGTLFRHAAAVTSDNFVAYYNLGHEMAAQGRLDDAAVYYQKALPGNPSPADAHYNLANVLVAQGRLQDAATHYEECLRLQPGSADAHNNLGAVLARLGAFNDAIDHFQAALQLKPNFPEAEYQLAAVLQKTGQLAAAKTHYAEAARLKPDWAEPLRALATILATNPQAGLRDGAEAVQLAERANELTGHRDPRVLSALDEAYAEAGRFEDAIKTARQVQALAVSLGQPALSERAAKRLELYRAGQAYRQ